MVSSTLTFFTLSLAALVSAYSKANFANPPEGNPTSNPGLGENVEAGKVYTVKWTPTTEGTVTIYMCKGGSDNCVLDEVPFADHVPNSGSFDWNVPATLEPSEGEGYGLQIVVDEGPNFGQYQYTPQFGVANPGYGGGEEPTKSEEPTGYPTEEPTETPSDYPTATPSHNATESAYPTTTPPHNGTSTHSTPSETEAPPSTFETTYPSPTGGNGTIPTVPEPTGNAAARVGLSFAAVAAAFFAL